jgi:succinate dehydrogenase flavin-adding protein (antitoxin of CptAB toxin-antitoxin module)
MVYTNKTNLPATDHFYQALTKMEKRLLDRLNRPDKIQHFLDSLAYGTETIYRSPLRVLRERTCQCFDGAVFAAAMLHRLGYPPLVLNLLPNKRDDDHVLALFQEDGHWGAVAKSNFAGLRFREPVYRSLREMIMSFFEHYYNVQREKTLRGYTRPLDLKAFDLSEWMTRDETMDLIARRLDEIRRSSILTKPMVARLSLVDERSCQAGLFGANKAGLYRPPGRMRQWKGSRA